MKKLFVIIILTILLVGCGKVEKFYLDDNSYEKGIITEITLDEFKTLESGKNSFAVFVYLPGCTSCAQFKNVLEDFVENNKIQFYSISILDVADTSIDEVVEFAPSMVLYKEGKVVSYLDSVSNDDKPALTNVDSFKMWLEEYVYLEK